MFTLRDSDVYSVWADIPEVNILTIGAGLPWASTTKWHSTWLAIQGKVISDRARKVLAEKKKLGFVLGRPKNLTLGAIEKGRGVRQQNACADEDSRGAARAGRFRIPLDY